MDIRTLYTLIAIADHGSFAEAGNAIGLSLSAVSMQVRALEEELGITIFDRGRRPPVLTDAGLTLVHRARDLITHWESMSASLKKGTASGLLKLGSVHTCASGVLPLALKHLQKQGRGLEVHVTTGLTHDLERAIYHRQLDVAIVTEPDVPRSGLDFLPFVEEKLVVIVHRSVKEKSDQEILEQTPYVRFNRAARVGNLVQEEMVRRHISVRSTMEIDNLEGVIAMVANGLGASVVPARGVKNEFPSSIRVIPFGSPAVTRRLGILAPKENPRSHLSRLLLEALKAVCADQHHLSERPT
ncbi:LysR family transcriptional regulator [Ottowia thiooxydans]|uniref:DNA-binding transcriptional LysR family regulator n=1 Tax=Ottowia thiooxydans TaxID=219182 RepID=A0ABV2QGV4_9BURK